MKIFIDTNFLVDYYVRPEYKDDSINFLELGKDYRIDYFVSYLSVANFAYITRKFDREWFKLTISNIRKLFHIVSNTDAQIEEAIKSPFHDFEDALQYQAALAADCDCIITRNQRDFEFSEIPVLSPKEFLEKYGD